VTAVAYHQPLAPAGDLPYAVRYAALDPRLRLRVVVPARDDPLSPLGYVRLFSA
jgi:hypothetical protein